MCADDRENYQITLPNAISSQLEPEKGTVMNTALIVEISFWYCVKASA